MENNPEAKKLQVKIEENIAEGLYVNISNILSSEAEFIFDFGRIMPAKPTVTILTRVITSPQHAKSFLLALKKNVEDYEAKFGEIKVGQPSKQFLGFQGGGGEPIKE